MKTNKTIDKLLKIKENKVILTNIGAGKTKAVIKYIKKKQKKNPDYKILVLTNYSSLELYKENGVEVGSFLETGKELNKYDEIIFEDIETHISLSYLEFMFFDKVTYTFIGTKRFIDSIYNNIDNFCKFDLSDGIYLSPYYINNCQGYDGSKENI